MTLMKWMRIMCAFGGIALMPPITMAQQYPSKPVRIIIGLGAGGTADALSRYFAQKLSTVLNTSVIVENKPGAGQLVAIIR
jgi:tripartite-type tricarboxylate transporter receptor subunit TctC